MSLETVPKDQRNLRACLLCSLVKVKIEFMVKLLNQWWSSRFAITMIIHFACCKFNRKLERIILIQ